MRIDFYLVALGMAMIPMASAAQNEVNTFEIDGIKYQEIEPVGDNPKEVMVCSPTAQGREYLLPISEEGTVDIPSQVEFGGTVYAVSAIEDMTFYDEPRLTSIALPESVVTIGPSNFSRCENLHTLDLSKVTLHSTPINPELTIPVGWSLALKTLILPETLAESLWLSFVDEYELETLHLPKTIQGHASFLGCLHGLASVSTIYSLSPVPPLFDSGAEGGDDSEEEYWYWFGNYYTRTNQPVIYVPQGCAETYKESKSWCCYDDIHEYDPSAPLVNIFKIDGIKYQEIEPVGDNPKEVMVCSPTAQGREYLLPISEEGTVNIPSQVEFGGTVYAVSAIEDMTFYDEPRLTSIALPESVVTIGPSNFSRCENLHTLDLSKVTLHSTPINPELTIPVGWSPALKTLILPETLAESLWWSFVDEYELETLHLPKTIQGHASFLGCLHGLASVSTIYSLSPVPPLFDSGAEGGDDSEEEYWYWFGNYYTRTNQPVIYVPKGCVETYKESKSWCCYDDIREYGSSAIEAINTIAPDETPDFTFRDGKIVASGNVPVMVFDLCGRKVSNDNLPSGIYVVRQGTLSTKFVVKD